MISIIICTRELEINQFLKNNIQETIGLVYELIILSNTEKKYSIFSAYNKGVSQAKYPYLCFMHDDILFHTKNWGHKVIEHFKQDKVGLIGVVGGHYMPDCPASWWSTQYKSGIYLDSFYDSQYNLHSEKHIWEEFRTRSETSISVTSVDGLWFCIPKRLFNKIKFDDVNFFGFHCYDLDICMQINKLGFEIRVIFDILIEHFSGGENTQELHIHKKIFYNKWKDYLPLIKGINLTASDIKDRYLIVNELYSVNDNYWKCIDELNRIKNSKAYILGGFILKPLIKIYRFFKSFLCNPTY